MPNTEHSDHAGNSGSAEESMKSRKDAAEVGKDAPRTVQTNVSKDVESDPALNDNVGQDWADEGGATPQGPATPSE